MKLTSRLPPRLPSANEMPCLYAQGEVPWGRWLRRARHGGPKVGRKQQAGRKPTAAARSALCGAHVVGHADGHPRIRQHRKAPGNVPIPERHAQRQALRGGALGAGPFGLHVGERLQRRLCPVEARIVLQDLRRWSGRRIEWVRLMRLMAVQLPRLWCRCRRSPARAPLTSHGERARHAPSWPCPCAPAPAATGPTRGSAATAAAARR